MVEAAKSSIVVAAACLGAPIRVGQTASNDGLTNHRYESNDTNLALRHPQDERVEETGIDKLCMGCNRGEIGGPFGPLQRKRSCSGFFEYTLPGRLSPPVGRDMCMRCSIPFVVC